MKYSRRQPSLYVTCELKWNEQIRKLHMHFNVIVLELAINGAYVMYNLITVAQSLYNCYAIILPEENKTACVLLCLHYYTIT